MLKRYPKKQKATASQIFREFLDKKTSGAYRMYPTGYGIGLLIGDNEDHPLVVKWSTELHNLFKKNKIKFYNEYSEKKNVFRFRIDLTEENLLKIKNLKF